MKINAIQVLRALAALLVVADHSVLTLVAKAGATGLDVAYASFLGLLGVQLFFMISGYIMIVSTRDRSHPNTQPLQFFWRRCVRVIPLYWIATTIYAVKQSAIGATPSLTELVKSYFFIPYVDSTGFFRPVYGLGWTLNYEMMFYLLFACSLLLRTIRSVFLLIAALTAAVILGAFLTPTDDSWFGPLLTFWTAPIMLCFCGGMVLAVLRIKMEARLPIWKMEWQSIPGVALVLGCCGLVYFFPSLVFLSPIVCVMAVACAGVPVEGHVATSSILRRGAVLLGGASYSLYLTHSFVLGPGGRIWDIVAHGRYAPVFTALMLVATSVVAIVVFRLVEQPLLRLFQQRSAPITGIAKT